MFFNNKNEKAAQEGSQHINITENAMGRAYKEISAIVFGKKIQKMFRDVLFHKKAKGEAENGKESI